MYEKEVMMLRISAEKRKGFTLIELLIAVALIGIVTVITYSLLSIGQRMYAKGDNQSVMQFDARTTLERITKEVRLASAVTLLSDTSSIPTNVTDGKCYIFTEIVDGCSVIRYKDKTGVKTISTFDAATLTFSTDGYKALTYTLKCTVKGESFSLNSEVIPLNMPKVSYITGTGSAAIQFTKNSTSTSNTLTFSSDLHNGYAGESYTTVTFTGTGGIAPYSFSYSSSYDGMSFPAGLTLSSNGKLTGTPTTEGDYTFDVTVKDSTGKTSTRTVQILIGNSSLTAVSVAAGITSPSVLGSTAILTLPTVPFGFEVYISNTTKPGVIDMDGKITHPTTGSEPVLITFAVRNLINISDPLGQKQVSISVPSGTGNVAPVAQNVSISGVNKINSLLSASYTYKDAENDLEGSTVIRWYRSDTATGTKTLIDTAKQYRTVIGDNGKYIFCEVMPVASSGTLQGVSIMSAGINIVTDNPPTVQIVGIKYNGAIVSQAFVGDVLTVDYTYDDVEGDTEFGTIITWYQIAADGTTTQLQKGSLKTYTVVKRDRSSNLVVDVTPYAYTGKSPGNTFRSKVVYINKK